MTKLTIGEVAKQAGVSKSTISRYLNGNFKKMSPVTRQKIEKTIKELDYHPNRQAQTLKTKKSGLIGFVVADMANMYSSRLISGASKVAREHNYQVLTMDSVNDIELEHDSLLKLRDQALEGLIIQPMSRNSQVYEELASTIPTVFVDRVTDNKQWPGVVVDNFDATHQIGELIASHHYKNVIMVSEPVSVSQARLNRVNGLKAVADANSINFELVEVDELQHESTRGQLVNKIKKATGTRAAVFTSNSRLLMLMLQIIEEVGAEIPTDIGLSGYDDWNWTSLTNPPLTSIEQDTLSVGTEAMKTLIDRISHTNDEPNLKVIRSQINIRKSI
ncbi:LacI family DNA-binding transcriptional regulator [Paucilactobacillus suebicus]|nr:LacI family DNA-binding transcriptional regulator [Paucilactobacillus suebicus]